MPLILDHPRLPPSGHYLADSTGVIHRAKSIPLLAKAIDEYRINNCLPSGDPMAEIEAFYVVQFPWLVSKAGESIKAPEEEMLREWINRLWKNPPKPKDWVESETARKRMEICQGCRFNLPGGIVSDVYLRRLIILGAGRIASKSSCCTLHRWDCGLAVWLESPLGAKPGAPPDCFASV